MKTKIYFLAVFLFLINTSRAQTQIITTIAGKGTSGFSGDGGSAINAEFHSLNAIAIDGNRNLYVSDYWNNRIRKVNASTKVVSTIAGIGNIGNLGDGGLAVNAKLTGPHGICVDKTGNIYIADSYNYRIRKITASTGIITTVAGTGIPGFAGDSGLATSAKLNYPTGIAVDAAGNLYIADNENNRIRKVNISDGKINTIAGGDTSGFSGDGALAVNALLNAPYGICLDGAGNVYFSDLNNSCIRKITVATGIINTVAGIGGTLGYSGDGGFATSANLNYPKYVFVTSNGDLYIADQNNSRIRKVIASTGIINTIVGKGTDGFSGDGGDPLNAELDYPIGICMDSSGDLYISDYNNVRIRKICYVPAQPGYISGSRTVCAGNTYKYSVVPVQGAVSYTWTLPSGWTGTSTSDTINVTAGSTVGNITVTANNECGPSIAKIMSVLHNGIPPQPAVINGSIVVCPGDSIIYSIPLISGAASYIWTLPSGWTGTSTTNSISAIADSSIGSITVTANNVCGSSPVQTLNIMFNDSLPPLGPINGPSSVCPGDTIVYSVTSIVGASSYTWTLPSGWSGTSTTSFITAIADSSIGSITVRANNACTSSSTQLLNIIHNGTLPVIDSIIGNRIVCSGSSNTYSIAPISGVTSYVWTLPAGWSGGYTANSLSLTAGISSGEITVKAMNSCATSPLKKLNILVRSSVPPVQPDTINGNLSICAGSSQNYSINPIPGATSYTWTLPAGWSGTSSSSSLSATAGSSSGNITVKANNFCTSSAVRSQNIIVSNSVPSQPSSISGNSIVCASSLNTYNVIPSSGATSYIWTLPIGWTGSSSNNSITVHSDTTGGNITVTAVNGCGSSAIRSSLIAVNSKVNTVVTQNGNSLTASEDSASYQWMNCDSGYVLIAGATTQNFISTINGNFAVIVSKNGCVDTSSCFNINTVSINEITKNRKVLIYPNPSASGIFTVEITGPLRGTIDLKIFNVMGDEIGSWKINQSPTHEINLSNQPKGIYFLKVGENLIKKLIVQ